MGTDPWTGTPDYPYYFGLHKNNQGQWSFWNYDRSEFPIGSYTNWGKGYPNGTDGCAILDSDDGVTLIWKTYSCDTDSTGLAMVLCQARACDTYSTVCCADCHLSGSMKPKQKVYKSTGEKSKKNFIKRWTMKDGKPMRIA
uniref:C-type lectin domain-containing protein n=1 Tax=Acrobeloides nanus TaxID=290746 RepID=A0A914CIS8_9BILA